MAQPRQVTRSSNSAEAQLREMQEAATHVQQATSDSTGVAQDCQDAVRLYTLAAPQGLASAQYGLGAMHADATGVAQDFNEAVRLYTLAAAQDYAKA